MQRIVYKSSLLLQRSWQSTEKVSLKILFLHVSNARSYGWNGHVPATMVCCGFPYRRAGTY